MSDKPTDDQPGTGAINKQAPEPQSDRTKRPQTETPDDQEGQTREPGYDEA